MQHGAHAAAAAADAAAAAAGAPRPGRMFSEVRGWGKIFQVYVGIEVFIYMPALYATCYTLQPTARLMRTSCGKQVVDRVASCLEHYTPSYHGKLVSLGSKIYGAPRARAFAEWALLMKVLAPVAFPAKIYIASKIVGHEDKGAHKHDKGKKAADRAAEPGLSEAELYGYGADEPALSFQPPPSPPPAQQSNLQATAQRWAHAHAGQAHSKHPKPADFASAQGRRGDDPRRDRREPDFHGFQ